MPQVDNMTLSDAINTAGRQRMLSQRIAKAYVYQGAGIEKLRCKQEMKKAIARFEKQQTALEAYKTTADISTQLEEVRKTWSAYLELLKQPPTKAAAKAVILHSESLLNACNRVVERLKAHASTLPETLNEGEALTTEKGAEIISLSGRQRMLSQRLAMFYMAKAWGLEDPLIEAHYTHSIDEYHQALYVLVTSVVNTDAIDEQLDLVLYDYAVLQSELDCSAEESNSKNVLEKTELLLTRMDSVTNMYSRVLHHIAE